MENEDFNNKPLTKKDIITRIVLSVSAVLIPTIAGFIAYFISKEWRFFEYFYLIAAAMTWLIVPIRSRHRDSTNLKNNGSVAEDKLSQDYRRFRQSQWLIVSVGGVLVVLSLICFFIIYF